MHSYLEQARSLLKFHALLESKPRKLFLSPCLGRKLLFESLACHIFTPTFSWETTTQECVCPAKSSPPTRLKLKDKFEIVTSESTLKALRSSPRRKIFEQTSRVEQGSGS